jgi:hypothetical protein
MIFRRCLFQPNIELLRHARRFADLFVGVDMLPLSTEIYYLYT